MDGLGLSSYLSNASNAIYFVGVYKTLLRKIPFPFPSSISKITIHLSPSSNLTRCVSLNYFCPSKWRDSSQLGSIDGKCFQQSTALFYGPNLSIFSLSLLYYFKQQEEKKKFKSDELNDKIMECKFFKFFLIQYRSQTENFPHFFLSCHLSYVIHLKYAWKNAFEL